MDEIKLINLLKCIHCSSVDSKLIVYKDKLKCDICNSIYEKSNNKIYFTKDYIQSGSWKILTIHGII